MEGLVNRFIALLVEELLQTSIVRALHIETFVVEADRHVFLHQIIEGLAVIHGPNLADRLFSRAEDGGTFIEQFFGQLVDFHNQVFFWHYFIYDSNPFSLMSVKGFTGAAVIEGTPWQAGIGDELSDESARQNTPIDFTERKGGTVGGDCKIGLEQLHESAANTEAVDHGDCRLVIIPEPFETPTISCLLCAF